MRKIAFGYSTRCNIKCSHCVAADSSHESRPAKMDLERAKEIIREMAEADVTGISFTAGEPFIYFDDLLQLIALCHNLQIYSRVVTNSYWASSPEKAEERLVKLKDHGLCQLRMSFSRWHQQHVPRQNIVNAANGCIKNNIDYYVSFVSDFSAEDNAYEQFLRDHNLKFFPEPVIYAGRAGGFTQKPLFTDYQDNHCAMNPYLAPDLTMYACCDAGSHFTTTNFFKLGNLKDQSIDALFCKSEQNQLYNCIRTMGISTIASFAGFPAREIVTLRKCELCKKMFDSLDSLEKLEKAAATDLPRWIR